MKLQIRPKTRSSITWTETSVAVPATSRLLKRSAARPRSYLRRQSERREEAGFSRRQSFHAPSRRPDQSKRQGDVRQRREADRHDLCQSFAQSLCSRKNSFSRHLTCGI